MIPAAWDQLAARCRGCRACPELAAHRHLVVVGDAPPGARVALVGEAPGAEEDRCGRPFVGRSGRLLDALLAEAGLPRREVAVLNVVKCRPPGNRPPSRAEATRCRGFLDAQLDLLDPVVVGALGATAAGHLLPGPRRPVAAARGQVHRVDGRAVVVSYHPAAALRGGPNAAARAGLLADLALLRELARA